MLLGSPFLLKVALHANFPSATSRCSPERARCEPHATPPSKKSPSLATPNAVVARRIVGWSRKHTEGREGRGGKEEKRKLWCPRPWVSVPSNLRSLASLENCEGGGKHWRERRGARPLGFTSTPFLHLLQTRALTCPQACACHHYILLLFLRLVQARSLTRMHTS